MWMPSNFDWYNMIHCTVTKFSRTVRSASWRIIVINKSSVPYCGSNDNNSIGVSLSEILFSFMLEKYIVCDACGLRSPSFKSSSVLHITRNYTSSMPELIKQGMQQKLESPAFDEGTLGMSNLMIFYRLQTIVVDRFRSANNNVYKDMCSIPMDMTVVLGLHKFSLQATTDHHGPSMYSRTGGWEYPHGAGTSSLSH